MIKTQHKIETCRSSDFSAVLELLRQLWPTKTIDPEAVQKVFDRALESNNQVYLCARIKDKLIGFASLTIKNNLWQEGALGHIDELVIDNAFRKRGIGKALLQGLIVTAQKKGCRRIELDSAFHRKEAHAFYESQGFENRAFLFSKVLYDKNTTDSFRTNALS